MPSHSIVRKILFSFVFVTILASSSQAVFAATPGAHENEAQPCFDIKGAGKTVLVGGVANSGVVDFESGFPAATYELCIRDTSGVGNGPFRLEGWAWDSNLGWISFYCNGGMNLGAACGAQNYSVQVSSTGLFSGYAWGDNTGWISFNSGFHQLRVEPTDPLCQGKVYGPASAPLGCAIAHTNAMTHVWSDNVGWLNFDGMIVPWFSLTQKIDPSDIVVDFDKNLVAINKINAPKSNDSDSYLVIVTINTKDGLPLDTQTDPSRYQVTITPHWIDTVKKIQTDPTNILDNSGCSNPGGAVTKPCDPAGFSVTAKGVFTSTPVTSKAPTSNMNGQADAAGNVIYSYEDFVVPASKVAPKVQKNQLQLVSVDIAIRDMVANVCIYGGAPTCSGLPQVVGQDFKFAPQTDVSTLKTTTSDSAFDLKVGQPVNLMATGVGPGTVKFTADIDASGVDGLLKLMLDTNADNVLKWDDDGGSITVNVASALNGILSGVIQNPDPSAGSAPQYVTGLYMYSEVSEAGGTVKYYSNKLPRVTGSTAVQPVAVLQGNIYSQGSFATTTTVQPIRSLGDVSSNVLRDTIYANVARIIGNTAKPSGNRARLVTDAATGGFKEVSGIGYDQTLAKLLPDASGNARVYYGTKDVIIGNFTGADVNWTGERTIIVVGGNVYIDANLYNNVSGAQKPKLGIIVLRDLTNGVGAKNQGNVYIDSHVTNIQANIFADGAVMSYSPLRPVNGITGEPGYFSTTDANTDLRIRQLLIEGTVASQNTVGGATRNPPILGDGTKVSSSDADRLRAQYYDLNYLRQYVGIILRDASGNALHSDGSAVANEADLRITDSSGVPWSKHTIIGGVAGDLIPPSEYDATFYKAAKGLDPQTQLGSLYVNFVPPSATLPGFGASAQGSQNQLPR